jgi:N utilization substance protein B
MGTRRKSRELALQILYQIDMSNVEATAAFDLFCQHFEGSKKSRPYALHLVRGVVERADEINALIARHAKNWRPERMSIIDRNILRVALFEMCFQDEVPACVVINEAIEVAKRFGTEESASFVNGILDAVSKITSAEDMEPKERQS